MFALCFVALPRGLVNSLVSCTTWAGACVALGPWRGRAVFYVGFIYFFFSRSHQSGYSLQCIMVLIILFLFWCLFLYIFFLLWAVVSSAPSAEVLPVTVI